MVVVVLVNLREHAQWSGTREVPSTFQTNPHDQISSSQKSSARPRYPQRRGDDRQKGQHTEPADRAAGGGTGVALASVGFAAGAGSEWTTDRPPGDL